MKIYNHYPLTMEEKAALPGQISKAFGLIVAMITIAGIALPEINAYRSSQPNYDPLGDAHIYNVIWGLIYGYSLNRLILIGFYIVEILTGKDFYSDCVFWGKPKRNRSQREL